MKHPYPIAVLAVVIVGAQAPRVAADTPDFDRYAGIVARMPFGVPAPVAQPAVAAVTIPVVRTVPFARSLRMCAVTRSGPAGTLCVGLVDTAANRNYYLAVGESDDDITVVAADYEGERALLRKGAEEGWVSMSSGPVDAAARGAAAPASLSALAPAADPATLGSAPAVASHRGNLRTVVPEYALMRRKLILESMANSSGGPASEGQRIE